MSMAHDVEFQNRPQRVDERSFPNAPFSSTQEYAFLTHWEIAAPLDRVWDQIANAERYPEWFPYVASTEQLSPGDEKGVGTVVRSQWTTDLPYGFVLETRTIHVDPPHLIEWTATGDLEGTGRWELSEYSGVTTARYYWTVRTTKLWMQLLTPLLLPAFNWNHAIVMGSGGEGLAKRLAAELIANRSYSSESTNVLVPLSRTVGLISLAVLLTRFLRR